MSVKKDFSRRKFMGLSAMGTAAFLGSSTFSLSGCKKEDTVLYGEESEAIVVGSGFGGAVVSLRLAEAGVKTLMIEMGKQYEAKPGSEPFCSTFNPDGRSTWLRKETILPLGPSLKLKEKYVGVLDRVDYENMKVYRGTCLGGGSVVYGAMLPQAQPSLWNDVFPNIDYAELDQKWYPKVKSIIDTSKVPDEILNSDYYEFARVGFKHCDRAGFTRIYLDAGVSFGIIKAEMFSGYNKYTTNADLLYGVNNGAKNSVDRNYIPAALGTGNLTIQTLTKVDNIKQLEDGRYEVDTIRIDVNGNTVARKSYTCKYLFICAGTVGTNEILVKSRETGNLPELSSEVGKGWGGNGNVMAMRSKLAENTGAKSCTIPVSGYFFPDNPEGSMLAEQAPCPFGIEMKSLLTLAITKNANRGEFVYNPSSGNVDLNWQKSQIQPSIDAMKIFIERLNNANGGELDRNFFPKGYSDDFTYHPLGGAILGKASDMFGRLKGYKNLYAIDGSMIPGYTAAANPALTIAAIAERCMENIVMNDLG